MTRPLKRLFSIFEYDQDANPNRNTKGFDSVPENVLQDVLDFLKELQDKPTDKVRLTNNLRQILAEDKALLEKLAQ